MAQPWGALLNVLVFPPGYVRTAEAAVRNSGHAIGDLLYDVASGLRSGWTSSDAEKWVTRACDLEHDADAAQSSINVGQEAQWWNPWPSLAQPHPAESYQPALDTLRHVALNARGIAGAPRDASREEDLTPPDHAFLADLAELLTLHAAAVAAFARQRVRPAHGHGDAVGDRVAHAEELHDTLTRRLRNGELPGLAARPVSGSLLLDVRRILQDINR